MGGRGGSSITSNKALAERYTRNAQKHNDMPIATKMSKSGQFNDMRFGGLDWHKEAYSKSSEYITMNRVSHDGDKIVVHVSDAHIKETKYGASLQLDADHVVYLKQWQVLGHTEPHTGKSGAEVVLDRKYWNPKQTKYKNPDFSAGDKKQYSFEEWKRTAKAQERIGNYVSIRV